MFGKPSGSERLLTVLPLNTLRKQLKFKMSFEGDIQTISMHIGGTKSQKHEAICLTSHIEFRA
jgi:hypothetical protein